MVIGYGVIGIGHHAERFMGPAISKAADTKFVAVCSRSIEKANNFASRHCVARTYDSLKKMLQDPELDVLYVATPNNLHTQNTIAAAEAGKHVLCEKPMALTEADCERMIETCNKNNVRLGVDFQNRYHPAHLEARRLVQDGKVGEIYTAKAQYCRTFTREQVRRNLKESWRSDLSMAGGGALMGTGLHPIDLLRFVLDSEIEEVQAVFDPKTPETVDEMVYVVLKLQNGVHGLVISGYISPRSDDDLVLYGSQAKITCKGTVGMLLRGELLMESDSINLRMTFPTNDPLAGNYIRVVEAFNRCIEENAELDISGENGLQMVRITNAILESNREGKSVKLSR